VRITDPFVEALSHDSIVIQMNRLKNRRRTELERLLSVFDQGAASRTDPHLLDILEVNFPERYREILRRLMLASAEPGIRAKIELEDDVLKAFQAQARVLEDLRKSLAEKDRALEESERAREESERTLRGNYRLIAELNGKLGRTES
jgi:hypothetical protein